MDAKTASTEKDTATEPLVFGYDHPDRAHRYDVVQETVIVTSAGAVEHAEQLFRAAVPDWIAYIRETCQWVDCWWHADTLPAIRHRAVRVRAGGMQSGSVGREAAE